MKIQNDAIILAAGRGSRLKELSLENPKPMTVVIDDTIIENLVSGLIAAGIERIVIVIGYMADKLKTHIETKFKDHAEFIFINNDIFDTTNNIYSLWLARQYMEQGFYLFEADVYCDASIINQLVKYDESNVMLVDRYRDGMDGTVVSINKQGIVTGMFLKRDQGDNFRFDDKYKTVNFYHIDFAFAAEYFLPKLDEHIQGKDVGSYYEQIIKEGVAFGYKFRGLVPQNGRWWEIDTKDDLNFTRKIFNISGK